MQIGCAWWSDNTLDSLRIHPLYSLKYVHMQPSQCFPHIISRKVAHLSPFLHHLSSFYHLLSFSLKMYDILVIYKKNDIKQEKIRSHPVYHLSTFKFWGKPWSPVFMSDLGIFNFSIEYLDNVGENPHSCLKWMKAFWSKM